MSVPAVDGSVILPTPRRRRRAGFIVWLRRAHGWIGLWGATLGLLFGSTGILLNHRALLRIPAA